MAALTLVLDLSASLYLALVRDGRVLASRVREDARGETAHALIDECFDEAGLGPESLDAIGVGAGPGSFTGIRVAVALAQGLAFPRRVPLHPISSLAAMLTCAGNRSALGLISANAGRCYVAQIPAYSEALLAAADVEALAAAHPLLVTSGPVTDALRGMGKAFAEVLRFEEHVDFARVAALALAQPAVRNGIVHPNYLMASAAEEKRRASEPSAGGSGSATGGR